jgi:hypothetical protein
VGGVTATLFSSELGLDKAPVDYQKELETRITEDDLNRFREYEHDRENLRVLADNVGDKRHSFRRLLKLQIGILDGSDLRKSEADAQDLAASQTGPARIPTHVQYAKILHLTGRPTEAVEVLTKETETVRSKEELYSLYWQIIVSSLAALDEGDINCAPRAFRGTVKEL